MAKISERGISLVKVIAAERAILIEVAWRAIKKDKVLAAFFERLYPRTGKKRAIVAVARKLIGRIRAAFEHGETYCLGYQAPQVLSP